MKQYAQRHPWVTAGTALVVALVVAVALFDWDWLRPSLERYVSQKTQREFRASHLAVKLAWNPLIRLDDVYFSNPAWAQGPAMARIDRLEFTVSLRDLFEGKVLVPRLALTGARIALEQAKDGRRNWLFSDPSDTSPTTFRISSLSVTKGQLHYRNEGEQFELNVDADTFAPASSNQAGAADRPAANDRFRTRFAFNGTYRGAAFSGDARTGDVLSFQESGIFFPIAGELKASTTRLKIDGEIADAATLSGIDVKLDISGQTLASLYPFLLLPLPATPPYTLHGRLRFAADRYHIEDLAGQIGSTDVSGEGTYTQRRPRPLLDVSLRSRQLVVSDLGPLIGMQTRGADEKPTPTQADTATRAAAQAEERRTSGGRVLPSGRFDGEKLKAIDARLTLDAKTLKLTPAVPLEGLHARMALDDGRLDLQPIEFGVAGGHVTAAISLDARQGPLKSDVQVEMRGLQIGQLLPHGGAIAKGAGSVGARIDLKGQGSSVADAAADADGLAALTITRGRISNLLDAASGLNGGKVLGVLATGDKDIAVNCGAVVFDVKDGIGTSKVFRVDTDQTEITGGGTFSLKDEQFDLSVEPLPKHPGLLSLRTPIQIGGTFRNPDVHLDKGPLLLRAGGAIALGALAPVAALLAFVEPGSGQSTDCVKLLTTERSEKSAAADKHDRNQGPVHGRRAR